MRDVAVIGAGPAGVAASIYLKRAGFEPLLFERDRIGGLLLNANFVENYPGFPEGIGGKILASLFEQQLSRLSVNIAYKEVTGIAFEGGAYKLSTLGEDCSFRTVIVATGSVPKSIDILMPPVFDEGKIFYEIKDIP
ncbi:MAG: NAD(P)/FAD-dependent oxidoreductase, partial [Thermoplasmata archaeon]